VALPRAGSEEAGLTDFAINEDAQQPKEGVETTWVRLI
jgi:hypothetical protein